MGEDEMKFIFTALTCLLWAQQVFSAPNIPPYSEDFESFTASSTTLTNGWSNSATDNQDWTVDINGTSSSNTGPTANGGADHNPGTSGGKYLYTETSAPSDLSDVYNLISPAFDFTGQSIPTLDFWYHMYGPTMGMLHIDISIDGGITFTNNITPAFTDNQDLWQQKIIFLPTYTGQANVVFRFRSIHGTSFTGDMAIDDFNVYDSVDSDGDGATDRLEGAGDRDGDSIDNKDDFDPSGYFYNELTGEIISGGSIAVTCDVGTPSFVGGLDGSSGYYQFVVTGAGSPSTCTITPTIPLGYTASTTCVDGGTLDVNPGPAVQNLGSSEAGATGFLADASCGANPFHLSLTINPEDAILFNNNIPLALPIDTAPVPTLSDWMLFLLTSLLLGFAWKKEKIRF